MEDQAVSDFEDEGVYAEDIWNDHTLNRYTFVEVVEEAVTILAYEYIEKNKGKKPSKKMISEWIEKLLKDQNES